MANAEIELKGHVDESGARASAIDRRSGGSGGVCSCERLLDEVRLLVCVAVLCICVCFYILLCLTLIRMCVYTYIYIGKNSEPYLAD